MPDQAQIYDQPKHDFLADYSVTTRADGIAVKVDAQGTFFIATDSPEAYPFDMSFDGQSFFKWNVGLSLPKPNGFSALWFRSRKDSTTGAYIPVNLEFLAGNVTVQDARLSIVRDPSHYQVFNFQLAQTLPKCFKTAIIPANSNIIFPGFGNVKDGTAAQNAGLSFSYRKSITISNNDPGSDLEIYVPDWTLTQSTTDNGDGTYSLGSLTNCSRAGTAFFRQAWCDESNADFVVANETGTDINCRVLELFYPSGVSPELSS